MKQAPHQHRVTWWRANIYLLVDARTLVSSWGNWAGNWTRLQGFFLSVKKVRVGLSRERVYPPRVPPGVSLTIRSRLPVGPPTKPEAG